MRAFYPASRGESTAGEDLANKRRKEFIESLHNREKEVNKANERTAELRRMRLEKAAGIESGKGVVKAKTGKSSKSR